MLGYLNLWINIKLPFFNSTPSPSSPSSPKKKYSYHFLHCMKYPRYPFRFELERRDKTLYMQLNQSDVERYADMHQNIFIIWYTWINLLSHLRFLSYVTSKSSSFLLWKNFQLIFASFYFYIDQLKKCLRFLKSCFKLELIFLSFVVSVDMFN